MLRKIIQTVGRFQVGATYDFPRGTWNKIAQDAHLSLDDFSQALDNPVPLQSMLKGRVRVHKRLGSGSVH